MIYAAGLIYAQHCASILDVDFFTSGIPEVLFPPSNQTDEFTFPAWEQHFVLNGWYKY